MDPHIQALASQLAIDPENWDLRRQVAQSLFANGRKEEAAKVISNAPMIPEEEEAIHFAAKVYASVSPEHGLHLLDELHTMNPSHAAGHLLRAKILKKSGDTDAAREAYAAAVATDPSLADDDLAEEVGFQGNRPAEVAEQPVQPVALAAPVAEEIHAPEVHLADAPVIAAPLGVHPAAPEMHASIPHDEDFPAGVLHPEPALMGEAIPVGLPGDGQKKDTSAKVSAIAVAVLLHVGVIALFAWWIISEAMEPPPNLVAVGQSYDTNETIKKAEMTQKTALKPAPPSAKSAPMIAAAATSPTAIPVIETPEPDPGLGSSFGDSGFGAGGFGDGMGAGGFGGPPSMRGRCTKEERAKRMRESGGNAKCERAVVKGLDWLQRTQNSDGSWGKDFPVAMTGFALLAYLGHCETPDSPKYGDTVMNAIVYLTEKSMKDEGRMRSNNDKDWSYEHGIATYALAEAYSIARYGKRQLPNVRDAVVNGIKIIIDGQTNNGGWCYSYQNAASDMSVSGWQIQALKAANHTKLSIPKLKSAMAEAKRMVENYQGGAGGFGYRGREDKYSLTGTGVLSLQMMGDGNKKPAKDGIKYIREQNHGAKWGGGGESANLYAWYYITQAMFQAGGDDWKWWNDMFRDGLVNSQNDDGSWPAANGDRTNQAKGDADTYRTCLCILMLEVYYRYLPGTLDLKKGGIDGAEFKGLDALKKKEDAGE